MLDLNEIVVINSLFSKAISAAAYIGSINTIRLKNIIALEPLSIIGG
jgi:hypothetical protein